MTTREQYEFEILHNDDYNISLAKFTNWVKDYKEAFKHALEKRSIYETAVDFSIPVIMVKYFKKVW